jgi:hypothetical protein
MEDISRELEREINKSKPKPVKKNRTIKVLVVDNNGNIRYGNRYKTLIILLSILSVISICTAIVFFHLYSSLSGEILSDKANLVTAREKIEKLTIEREQLIAQLVLSGQEPEILNNTEKAFNSESEQGTETASEFLDEEAQSSGPISEQITEEKISETQKQ